jgi:hypothetical protein
MKPTLNKHPRLSQNYRTIAFDSRGGRAKRPDKANSFRNISDSFLRREQPRHFAGEIALFVILVLSAGISLYACALALNQFLAIQ